MIVVDTDILIDTGRGVEEALVYLVRIENRFSASISAVTEMELIMG